jgi:hypothetical protein
MADIKYNALGNITLATSETNFARIASVFLTFLWKISGEQEFDISFIFEER